MYDKTDKRELKSKSKYFLFSFIKTLFRKGCINLSERQNNEQVNKFNLPCPDIDDETSKIPMVNKQYVNIFTSINIYNTYIKILFYVV